MQAFIHFSISIQIVNPCPLKQRDNGFFIADPPNRFRQQGGQI